MPTTPSKHHNPITASTLPKTKTGITGILNVPLVDQSSDRGLKHTYASYRRENIPELDSTINPETQNIKSWTLSIPITIPPNLANATLDSLVYNIHYASFGVGSAFVQTDVVLSNSVEAAEGIITDMADLAVYAYRDDEQMGGSDGYAPPVLNDNVASLICSRPSFKGADLSGWCHYIDHREIHPNVPIVRENHRNSYPSQTGGPSTLYLFLHVYESYCVEALRNVDIDVTATWSDGRDSGGIRNKVNEVEEIRKEREKLVIAKREVELMMRRLEENTRTSLKESERWKEWEERVLEKVKERAVKVPDDASERGYAIRLGAENAILKVMVEVEKFREEVKRYRQEEAVNWERMEQTNKKKMDELVEIQKTIRQEIMEHRARMDVEKTERDRRAEGDIERRREGILEPQQVERWNVWGYGKEREDTKRKGRVETERRVQKMEWEDAPDIAEGELAEKIKKVGASRGMTCESEWSKDASGAKKYVCAVNAMGGGHKTHALYWPDLVR